jgi:hypothetical protein
MSVAARDLTPKAYLSVFGQLILILSGMHQATADDLERDSHDNRIKYTESANHYSMRTSMSSMIQTGRESSRESTCPPLFQPCRLPP